MNTKRKTLLSFLICLLCAILTFAFVACGETTSESESQPPVVESKPQVVVSGTNGLEYTLSDDGEYYIISGYNGTARKIVCGDYYKDLPIKEIGDNAFRGTSVETVNVTDGIEKIGEYAFFSCKQLSTLNLGSTVVEIGDYAFSACSSLTNVILPEGLTTICDKAFYRTINLISVSIPETISSIGCEAFEGCTNLQFSIYDNAKYLGNTDNKYVALIDCDSEKTSCAVNGNAKVIAGGAFENLANLTTVTVASGVTAIGDRAFNDCSNLEDVSLPNTLQTIGTSAFAHCSDLDKINLPASLVKIGDGAFSHSGLTNAYIPDGVEKIDAYTFNGCLSLTSIELGLNITEIGAYAFNDCSALYAVTFKSFSGCKVSSIGAFAFNNCKKLPNRFFMPASVTTVEENAFLDTFVSDVYTFHTTSSWAEYKLDSNLALEGFKIYFFSENEPANDDANYFYLDKNGNVVNW